MRRGSIGYDEHIRFIDGLPAANTGSVKAESVFKGFFFDLGGHDSKMLPMSGKIGKAKIDDFNALICDHRKNVLWRLGHILLLSL